MDKQSERPILILFVGPPGSGKSTVAKQFDGFTYISQDEQGREGHKEIFNQAIKNKDDIVVDRMNFSKKQRNRYLEPAKKAGYDTVIKVYHVPKEVCLDRCLNRETHPTIKDFKDANKAVEFFFKNYGRVKDHEADLVSRQEYKIHTAKTKAIVCDLDGTLANVEHRRKYVRVPEGQQPNWKKFFDEMVNDSVNYWCRELLEQMIDKYPVIYATGRPSDYFEHTDKWLEENGLKYPGYKLFMRPEGDYRSDWQIKEIIYEFEIKPRYDILFVVDDRSQVVRMWRDHGEVVLQCADGNF